MTLFYKNKKHEIISTENISADVYTYSISEEDMLLLNTLMDSTDYEPRYISMQKEDSNIVELLYDDILQNRVVVGGLIGDKYLLKYFVVYKGMNELLIQLTQV